MKYEEMSDGGVNWKTHLLHREIPDGVATICASDYCNTHKDWFELADKYGMSIDVKGKASIPKSVSGLNYVISATCKGKIGRAVAICFLKMKDAEVK